MCVEAGSPTETGLPMFGLTRQGKVGGAAARTKAAARTQAAARTKVRARLAAVASAVTHFEALDPRVLLSAGQLDTTFGTNGLRSLDFGSGNDFGYAVVVQSDGRILAAGTA